MEEKPLCKEDPYIKKKQLWSLQRSQMQNYVFRQDITYGCRYEKQIDPLIPVKNADSYGKNCQIVQQELPIIHAYTPRLRLEDTNVKNEQARPPDSFVVTKRPGKCFLEVD